MPDFSTLFLLLPGILMALTVHEYAHGLSAYRLGDSTAKDAGRLTLNPLSHLDPIGTLMLFIVHFGWAKPVPVDPYNFAKPRRDMMIVAAAGPAANVILATILGMLMRVLLATGTVSYGHDPVFLMLSLGIFINLVLAFFNLLPVPPLDGSKIVRGLLPFRHLPAWDSYERRGGMILLILIGITWLTSIPVFAPIFFVTRFMYRIVTAGLSSPF